MHGGLPAANVFQTSVRISVPATFASLGIFIEIEFLEILLLDTNSLDPFIFSIFDPKYNCCFSKGVYASRHTRSEALSIRIRIFFNPQLFLCGFKFFHVHTYPDLNRIVCPFTRSRFVLVSRTPRLLLSTKHAP